MYEQVIDKMIFIAKGSPLNCLYSQKELHKFE